MLTNEKNDNTNNEKTISIISVLRLKVKENIFKKEFYSVNVP